MIPDPGCTAQICLGLFFCFMLLVTPEEDHLAPVAFLWVQRGCTLVSTALPKGLAELCPRPPVGGWFLTALAARQAVLLQQVASPHLPCCWRQDQPTMPPFKPLTSPPGPPHLPLCFHYCFFTNPRALLAPPLHPTGFPGGVFQAPDCREAGIKSCYFRPFHELDVAALGTELPRNVGQLTPSGGEEEETGQSATGDGSKQMDSPPLPLPKELCGNPVHPHTLPGGVLCVLSCQDVSLVKSGWLGTHAFDLLPLSSYLTHLVPSHLPPLSVSSAKGCVHMHACIQLCSTLRPHGL